MDEQTTNPPTEYGTPADQPAQGESSPGPGAPTGSAAPTGDEESVIQLLVQHVQQLEDLVEELIEVALVNRAGLIASVGKKQVTRDELRKVYDRIEQAHEEARAGEGDYRILPRAAAYFLEDGR